MLCTTTPLNHLTSNAVLPQSDVFPMIELLAGLETHYTCLRRIDLKQRDCELNILAIRDPWRSNLSLLQHVRWFVLYAGCNSKTAAPLF